MIVRTARLTNNEMHWNALFLIINESLDSGILRILVLHLTILPGGVHLDAAFPKIV